MTPAATARELLRGFLPAWLGGGNARVGQPVGEAELRALARAVRAGEVPESVAARRRLIAGALAPVDGSLALTEADVPLVAVLYNLLALGNPALDRFGARPFALGRAAAWTVRLARAIAPPRTVPEALARHGLVGPLFEAERVDVDVAFWLGHRRFAGVEPPRRLTRMAKLRRVAVSRLTVPLAETFDEDADRADLVDRLLLLSPLTDLASADRPAPGFGFGRTARWLEDPQLCRGLCYRWLGRPDPLDTGGVLALATLARLRGSARSDEVLLLLHTLYHLHLLTNVEALVRHEPRPTPGGPGLVPGTHLARLYIALFKVLYRGGEHFGLPTGDELGEPLASRLGDYDAALKAIDTHREERLFTDALRERMNLVGFPGYPRAGPPLRPPPGGGLE